MAAWTNPTEVPRATDWPSANGQGAMRLSGTPLRTPAKEAPSRRTMAYPLTGPDHPVMIPQAHSNLDALLLLCSRERYGFQQPLSKARVPVLQ